MSDADMITKRCEIIALLRVKYSYLISTEGWLSNIPDAPVTAFSIGSDTVVALMTGLSNVQQTI